MLPRFLSWTSRSSRTDVFFTWAGIGVYISAWMAPMQSCRAFGAYNEFVRANIGLGDQHRRTFWVLLAILHELETGGKLAQRATPLLRREFFQKATVTTVQLAVFCNRTCQMHHVPTPVHIFCWVLSRSVRELTTNRRLILPVFWACSNEEHTHHRYPS
jgi:hypothetical protein